MLTCVALLRAVNLGSRGSLAMADLRTAISDLGGRDVTTYLRSGNVVFTTAEHDPRVVEQQVRAHLATDLGLDTAVLVRTAAEITAVAESHPFAGQQDDLAKLHVAFLAAEPDAERVAALDVPAGAPEQVLLRGRELYLHYPAGAGRSKVTAAYLQRRLGVELTARNWRTVTALAELAGDHPTSG
ncbi:DUF1697 domain-containing protein [Saccharopolyspora sp. WRP15-2]|uniref:DUF1697 domain-containing protein n=1 Tax=Saccharopolyspora oryzae TaxID=2997343 RepID=A0ABT4V137_9PSEU|nr:DUF1697 domain-containing protein [Saccharopolyspora oryzae]MDA3627675.1 DUF1697 domain-containing protein [Saccharopolyspora oryzae]